MRRPGPIIGVAVLVVVLLAIVVGGSAVAAQASGGPDQPVDFTHSTHATALGIDCTFCHRNAGRPTNNGQIGVPSVEQCMFCHKVVTLEAGDPTRAREIARLRQASDSGSPINWVRVHRVPDHVRFVHEAHVRYLTANPPNDSTGDSLRGASLGAGAAIDQVCATCHGQVNRMQKVQQVRPLKMGDCVSCHRQNNAPTDCTTCHK